MGGTIPELVRQQLADGKLLQLATQGPHGPRVSHLWFASTPAADQIVFVSKPDRNHSADLLRSPQVGGGVIAIDLEGYGQKVRGLTLEGTAAEARGMDGARAADVYTGRWPNARDRIDSGVLHTYVVNIFRYVLFDEVNFPDEPRQVWTLR